MSGSGAAESLEPTPEPLDGAGTPQNRHKGIGPTRKALAAVLVGAFLLGGTAYASNGFSESRVDAIVSQSHESQALGGPMSGHTGTSKGGLGTDAVKGAPAVPAEPVNVPVGVKHDTGERYGTVRIPKFGADWEHYLVEGATDENLALPGTDDPNAVQNYETAIAHNTGTQELGRIGNVGLEGHRTENTFAKINTLQHGDQILVTDAKTGTIYTYAVTQTVRDNPDTIAYLATQPDNPDTEERGLPYRTKAEQDKASAVMDPIPFDDNSISTPGHPAKNPAKDRLLTMTSCGIDPATTAFWRVYVIAKLQSVTAGKAGA